MRKIITLSFAILAALMLGGCNSTDNNNSCAQPVCAKQKLTKDMFYKNGKFDEEAAKQAYFDMMERLGYPISENMRKNMWATDFNLGDFPNVGMGGIFWAMEDKYGVFGHEILLLPNQMLAEHWHVATAKTPAKYEAWHCRAGVSYCFGEEGEAASKYPNVVVPASQKDFTTTKDHVSVACAKKGNVVWLNRILNNDVDKNSIGNIRLKNASPIKCRNKSEGLKR